MKKILITGATGSIGRNLVRILLRNGNEIYVLSQNTQQAKVKLPAVKNIYKWNYNKPEDWKHYLNGIDVAIHLAGANLGGKRWNEEFKKIAYDSRVQSTRNLVEAIKQVEKKPKLLISANAVGIYGNRYDEVLDETSTTGNDFLANMCKDWETEVHRVEQFGVRSISIRTGLVLIKDEGVLKQLYLPFKFFIGGPLAGGNQWFPWIHIDDIVGIYLQAIENETLRGPINAASPGIVRMKEFAGILGKVLNRPSILPIPKFAMKIAAGEVANYAVMSQRTSVKKITESGYKFKFENLEDALKDLLK